MRFALLGNDNDGIALARALLASGRHHLVCVTSTPQGQPWPDDVRRVSDLEEILADPAIEAILVGSNLTNRAQHIRRALQSERVVLCLHPIGTRVDVAYEAGMIQQDSRQLLLPIMPEAFHPAIGLLTAVLGGGPERRGVSPTVEAHRRADTSPLFSLGSIQLLEIELRSAGEVLLATNVPGELPCVPFWNVLRALGGEVVEVSAIAPGEQLEESTPVLVSGRFAGAGLFQMSLLPRQHQSRQRLRITASGGEAELLFPLGEPGPCFLSWRVVGGELREDFWDAWTPWPAMVGVIEQAIARHGKKSQFLSPVSWQDAIRCLELDDAARRSVQRRRTVQVEYPEASEEVSFKGTMTLVGCALLWMVIFLAILSRWQPWIGKAVGPVLGIFLLLQLLRWIIPAREPTAPQSRDPKQ